MPCSTEPCIVGKTYEIRKPAPNLRDSKWMNYVPIEKRNKMSRPFKSLVVETVFQLCSRNDDLEKSGVTHKQLHTVLSLRLSRGTSPALITALIEKEIHSKTIVKNSLGNYSMNPELDDMESLLVPEESSSDSNPESKEKNSTTEQVVDSSHVTVPQKSPTDEKSNNDEGESDKMEVEEEEEPPVRKQRRRRTRKPRVVVVEPDEPETPERSPSPSQQQTKRTGRSVLVTNSNGRRIIRKITKYDPSEFYMTPLIRKKTKGVVEEPKVKLKRGRPSLKAKLAAAAAAAALASTTSAPLKKYDQIKRETKTSKQAAEPSKSPATKAQPTSSKPQPEPKDEADEEELEVTESWICQQSSPVKSSASMLKNECYLCSKLANVNDDKETLACSLCLNIAHNKCVVDDSFYKELKKWRCSECLISDPVICSVCDKEYKKSGGAMVMCDFCEEMFHVNCHDPPVKLPISSFSWRCSLCPQISITDALIGGREDLRSSVGTYAFTVAKGKPSLSACGGPACLPTPALPPEPSKPSEEPLPQETQSQTQSPQHQPSDDPITIKTEPPEEVAEIKEEEIDDVPPSYKFHRPGEPIPKVDDWSPKEVAEYFSERFGPIVGNAFLSQEIDGKSLKLMRRNDVTEQLGLQFGIALKVLYYVKKIQLNTNVIQELWA